MNKTQERLVKKTLRRVLSWARMRPSEMDIASPNYRRARAKVVKDIFGDIRYCLGMLEGKYDYPPAKRRT